jgi:hypothetical protein
VPTAELPNEEGVLALNSRAEKQTDMSSHLCLTPTLGTAIQDWYEARSGFQSQSAKDRLTAYCKATDELGQSIAAWQAEQPELAEQFRFWFHSHQDVWSADGADAASSL